MCYFVFVGIAESRRAFALSSLVDAGFHVGTTGNDAIRSCFLREDSVLVVSHGGCSCGIYAKRPITSAHAAQLGKYRKKGWSEAKIRRAMAAKRDREPPMLAVFRDCFASIVRASGSARILAHSFAGDMETEQVCIERFGLLDIEEYLACGGSYSADLVHDVRAR